MKRPRYVVLALVLAGPAFILGPASAAGTVIGQTPSSPGLVGGCGPGFFVQKSDVGSPSYTTTAGVITSWSIMSASFSGTLRLKVVRPLSATTWSVTGVSELRTPAPDTLNTFPARIPIVAGDRLALFLPSSAGPCYFQSAAAGDVLGQAFGDLTDFGVGGVHTAGLTAPNELLDVSATVEPDADGDGFGDLTQDSCPSRPDKTVECVPPDTIITAPKTVRTTKKKAKVSLLFLASEVGASFTCSVDGRPAKPCASPFKVKLKLGNHYIAVTATDAAGNADPTPATVAVKVKRKKA
jgi:hypothetical protein